VLAIVKVVIDFMREEEEASAPEAMTT